MTVPTVVWWRQDADDRLLELLVVGPGPISGQAWPGTIAQPARRPGEWAVVNLPALDALPDGLVEQLGATAGDDDVVAERDATLADELYDSCVQAALAIVGRRLAEPVVAAEPFSSGVLLARSAPGGLAAAAIELAPAITGSEGPVRRRALPRRARLRRPRPDRRLVLLRVRRFGGALGAGPVVGVPLLIDRIEQLGSGSVAISLGGAAPATLPSVSILLPADPAESTSHVLELAVPDLRLPAELLNRWRPSAGEDPRLRLAV